MKNNSLYFSAWVTWLVYLGKAASLVAQMVKNLPAMQETWVWSLGQEDPLEEGMATHCSILAWRILWTEKPGGLQSTGPHKIRLDWAAVTAIVQRSRIKGHIICIDLVPSGNHYSVLCIYMLVFICFVHLFHFCLFFIFHIEVKSYRSCLFPCDFFYLPYTLKVHVVANGNI